MSTKIQKQIVNTCYGIVEQEAKKRIQEDTVFRRLYLKNLKRMVEKDVIPGYYIQKLREEGREATRLNPIQEDRSKSRPSTPKKSSKPTSPSKAKTPSKPPPSKAKTPSKAKKLNFPVNPTPHWVSPFANY